MSILVSLLMGAVLGFAAHRAGLCTVKAAAEVLTSRRGHFLWSFAKSAAWVMALTAAAGAFGAATTVTQWPLTVMSVAGGVLFGVGAGLNGGCTFSTLTRAIDGKIALWGTVVAWPVGMWVGAALALPHPSPIVLQRANRPSALLLLVGLWLVWESLLILRRLRRMNGLHRALAAPVYTLSAGAALVGVSNAVIIESTGPWSFTSTILCATGTGDPLRCQSSVLPWLILLAALLGMAVSSVQRGSFAIRLPRLREAMRHVGAGLLMGLGTTLIPGGNDGLILFAIPSLSPHAIPGYLGLFAGVVATLAILRAFGHPISKIQCQSDICRAV